VLHSGVHWCASIDICFWHESSFPCAVLVAEWQPILHPTSVIPLCEYIFPVCIKLLPKDSSELGSFVLPSLTVTPASALQSQYSSAPKPPHVLISVGTISLTADMACANVTILPQLFHAGYESLVSFHVRSVLLVKMIANLFRLPCISAHFGFKLTISPVML
jgi:hypothetical protein